MSQFTPSLLGYLPTGEEVCSKRKKGLNKVSSHDFFTSAEEEQQWISDNLDPLWECAEKQYRKYGRGALIVDPRKIVTGGSALELGYALQCDIEHFRDLVDGYDPETEMVIEVARPGGKAGGYQASRPEGREPRITIVPTGEISVEEKLKMLADKPHIRLLTIMSNNPDDIRVAQEAGFTQDAKHKEMWRR